MLMEGSLAFVLKKMHGSSGEKNKIEWYNIF